MSHLLFRNLINTTRQFIRSTIPRNSNLHTFGIIPGAGLCKLRGIKEEYYFWRQEHKLFENLKNVQATPHEYFDGQAITKQINNQPSCTCSVKHKNLSEEAYFLSDHCDCLKLLRAKLDNQEEN